MDMKPVFQMLLVTGLLAGTTAAAPGAGPAAAEQARIDGLLSHVADMKGAAFIRNGKAYDAAAAAVFLRRKLEARAATVTNAVDFIARIASRSSTTGRPYRIRFADGTETDCGAYLSGVLEAMKAVDANPAGAGPKRP